MPTPESLPNQRRSLMYIRLAAHLADQPPDVKDISMMLKDVEALLGDTLPGIARFPSWWKNDPRRMHSRAWLTAGWRVREMKGPEGPVVFQRQS